MQLHFTINFKAQFGQSLRLRLLSPLGMTLPLSCSGSSLWQGSCQIDPDPKSAGQTELVYIYELVTGEGKILRQENTRFAHRAPLSSGTKDLFISDQWCDEPERSYLFTRVFAREEDGTGEESSAAILEGAFDKSGARGARVTFRAYGALPENTALYVTGSATALGSWDPAAALKLRKVNRQYFTLSLPRAELPAAFEYKFFIKDENAGTLFWQSALNARATLDAPQNCSQLLPEGVVYKDEALRLAGTAVPVFSLRSEGSCGIGDFGDLKVFIQWAAECGQRMVQLLPINDTTQKCNWIDSYPYCAISIYALHPLYVDLRQLPKLKNAKAQAAFLKQQAALNARVQLDYDAVFKLKMGYLRDVYAEQAAQLQNDTAFKDFLRAEREWLLPYAVFSYLRDSYGTADFSTWQERTFADVDVKKLLTEGSESRYQIYFYAYVQYVAIKQLTEVSSLARTLNVSLKGDIPIGISRQSVEAWQEPEFFNLDGQAGAPPDPFAKLGQNWGLPTYNWQALARDGYAWWKKRFTFMARFFDAYRIDHILGFFRIWQIPLSQVHGLLGQFVPALGFSAADLASRGLQQPLERYVRPYIDDALLTWRFGDQASLVRDNYLASIGQGRYALRPQYQTQRQVVRAFEGKDDATSKALCEGLLELIDNVLLVPDYQDPSLYHPRINAHEAYTFTRLPQSEQYAFRALHDHYFYERHNQFWYEQAMEKLPSLIHATQMLTCGEDLGMVPDCVPWVMQGLKMLSLEIERMPKALGQSFNQPSDNPERSVCTTGTHDMNTLRGWWQEDSELTARYYRDVLGKSGKAPSEITPEITREIIRRHLASRALLCVLPLQDWMGLNARTASPAGLDDRINVPAITPYYWRYRMHLTLEELRKATALNKQIKDLIKESGRI